MTRDSKIIKKAHDKIVEEMSKDFYIKAETGIETKTETKTETETETRIEYKFNKPVLASQNKFKDKTNEKFFFS